jgi:hypothetical protein
VQGGDKLFFASVVEGVAGAQFGDEFGDAVLIILREIGRMPVELAVAPDELRAFLFEKRHELGHGAGHEEEHVAEKKPGAVFGGGAGQAVELRG